MAPITLEMIRRRAEHNEGMVSNLEEVSLHQQEIERIEALGHVCRHLKILYMQNNLVSKLENLHRLKELEYANFAVNNISKIENLQRCESLVKLDLTVNFIAKASLLTVHTLEANYQLEDLYLMGNPCADFSGYRAFVVATLPGIKKLDGKAITPSERILAEQDLPRITAQLMKELREEGVDIEEAMKVSDARDLAPDEDDVAAIAEMPEDERPWCAATRVAEQRETARQREENERKKKEHHDRYFNIDGTKKVERRAGFPELPEDYDVDDVKQCNESGAEFRLDDSEDGASVVLDVKVGKYMDTSLMDVDVQTRLVRVLVKWKMLCLVLPEEVKPDAACARRSKTTGSLVVTMPKARRREKVCSKEEDYVVDGVDGVDGGAGAGGKKKKKGGNPANPGTGTKKLVREMGAVSVRGIVRDGESGSAFDMVESVRQAAPASRAEQVATYGSDDDDEPPPL